jgi:hypothetical protein
MTINARFGGKQAMRRDTEITAGCLGPFRPELSIGDTQYSQFKEGDSAPFYAPTAPESDTDGGTKTVAKKGGRGRKKKAAHSTMQAAAEAEEAAKEAEQHQTRGHVQERQAAAVVVETEEVQVMIQGYIGKQKGLMDILKERGLLDIYDDNGDVDKKKYARYSLKSKIDDETGQVSDEFNLRAIAAKCPDYEAEESYVEFLIKEKGGLVLKTPKCHPEIAGQGIEYSNGKAKYHFRKFNTGESSEFESLVMESVSPDVLTIQRVRRFARKAREYKLAYLRIAKEQKEESGGGGGGDGKAALALIEKYRREYKSHRSSFDTDRKFIAGS